MSYKMKLQWFDKKIFYVEGEEFSAILDNNIYFLDKLGLSDEEQIYDGAYDVSDEWISVIQGYFQHQINLQQYDYQLAFRYI